MCFLEELININYQSKYQNSSVSVGECSYGIPYILYPEDQTKAVIGKFCSIALGVKILLCGEHRKDWITTYPFNVFLNNFVDIKGHPVSKGDVIIGNDVWIGSDAKIMSGVTIGDGAIIAANALVTHDVEPYTIVGGIPARFIRKRFSDDIIHRLLEIQWWNWDKELIFEAIPLLQSSSFEQLFEFYYKRVKK